MMLMHNRFPSQNLPLIPARYHHIVLQENANRSAVDNRLTWLVPLALPLI